MAGEIGKATIEIVADLSKFPADLRRKLKAAFAAGVQGADIDKSIANEAAKGGDKAATEAAHSFERKAKTEFDQVGKRVGRGLIGSISGIFRRDGGRSGGFASGIRGLFSSAQNAIQSGAQQLSSVASNAFSSISGVFSGGGDITSLLKAGAIAAAIPAVFGLAGALVHLSGILLALPAAFGFLAAAIAPVIIGFQGFGEALGAGFSGDAKKFEESLKNLPLGMRAVIKEFVAFRGPLQQLKKDVQQSVFTELVGQIKPLLRDIIPVLSRGLVQVGGSISQFLAGFVELLHQNDILDVFDKLFASTARIIDTLGPPLLDLFGTLFGVLEHGLPFLERIFGSLGDGIERFSKFLSGSLKDGSFERFLNDALEIGGKLFTLLGKIGELIGAIFGGDDVQEGSSDFLDSLIEAVQRLVDFFKSEDGKKAVADFMKTVHDIGTVIETTASVIAGTIRLFDQFGSAVTGAGVAVLAFLQWVGQGFVDAVEGVGKFFSKVGTAVADFFTKTIPGWFDKIVGFFKSLPDKAVEGGQSLADKLKQWLLDAINGLIDFASEQLGRVIGLFLALPFLIVTALANLKTFLLTKAAEALIATRDFVAARINDVVTYFQLLPGRISNALTTVKDRISERIREGIDLAKQFVSNGIDSIQRFFSQLPGKISALGPALLNAAKGLGHKIGDGLSSIGNFASDIGSRIVSTIKGGINRIIDGINRGIGDIDSKIPINLPRLPHFERGGVVDSPTVALIGEKSKREVILPLTDPARTRELAQQSGLTKILGGGSAAPVVNLTAVLDGFGLIKVIDMRVDAAFADQGAELAFGART